jgi:glycolate oxidase
MYKSVDNEILKRLRDIVGEDGLVLGEDQLEPYSHDETPLLSFKPEAAVRPKTTTELSRLMQVASEEEFPVTPRGGGTGLSGGALPVLGGVVVSFERMNRVKDVDQANLMVVVEPGVITAHLDQEVERSGLFYPPDPVSLDSCTLGGNIAECAGGPRAVKYGVTRNYVQGLEVVFPNGEIGRMGGKLLKDVTGYSLMDLLIGSEGTLALLTEATLRLLPRPVHRVDLLVPFPDARSAIGSLSAVMNGGVVPATMELMQGRSLKICERFLKREIPFSDAEIHILLEIDGKKEDLSQQYETIGEIVLERGALDVMVAEDKSSQEKVWEPRKNIGDALKEFGSVIIRDDLVVPPSEIPQLLDRLKSIEEKHGVEIHSFGHVGDGNIHVDIDGEATEEERESLISALYRTTLDLGGSITAEHGIGYVKKRWLGLGLDRTQVELMKRIKSSFDPKNILNPGKMFEE